MEILSLQVFVSLILVLGAVLLLAWSVKQSDGEHADRLSLFPIEHDDAIAASPPALPGATHPSTPNPS